MAIRARIAVFAGLTATVAGFVLMTLAWGGAASRATVQGQFPYLLSGGIAGLGLVMAGLAFTVIQLVKVEGERRARQLAQVINAVDDLAARLAGEGWEGPLGRAETYWIQPQSAEGAGSATVPTWHPSP